MDPPGRLSDCTRALPKIEVVSSASRIGILAVQGNFREHAAMLRRLGAEPVEVRKPEQLAGLDGLIIPDRRHLGLLDLDVSRNAYGRQVASFEADLALVGDDEPLRGVFIRAPRVREWGPEVEVLAELDGEPVLLREGRFVVASFHPELTGDTRVHERFLELVAEEAHVRA